MSVILYVAAVVLFVLGAFGATPLDTDKITLLSTGLAFFALAHFVP